MGTAWVDLYWLPLGAGDRFHVVRGSGRLYEAILARWQHRPRHELFHCALEVGLGGERFVIEMAPVWLHKLEHRGVVVEGGVGLRWLGRWRAFRYEVRCWRGGIIPDACYAVDRPRRLSTDSASARHVLELVSGCPRVTWGRDELRAGEMWNSNSLIAWLLVRSGHDVAAIAPPAGGRAPGWLAGVRVGRAERAESPWAERAMCSPTVG